MKFVKRWILVLFAVGLFFSLANAAEAKKSECTTIQNGELLTSDGRVIETGADEWEYNYQARIFNGGYCDAYRNAAWCQPWKDVSLQMKWNDAWLSNKDCNDDGLLDRHNGYSSYIGSGAWLTNHQSGINDDGSMWNYFVKIVAKPNTGFDCAGAGGYDIWGEFCAIQEVINDPSTNSHGVQLLTSPAGFGAWK